jgi:hypothetical protein
MTKEFEGTLVRFDNVGVGVVDVEAADEYLYFTPKQIDGYGGETLDELTSGGAGNWVNGATVLIEADLDPSGHIQVNSVRLK